MQRVLSHLRRYSSITLLVAVTETVEGRIILAYDPRVQSTMAGEAWQQEPGVTGHSTSTLRKQREMHAGAQLTPFDSAQRMVSCTTTVGLSTSTNPI